MCRLWIIAICSSGLSCTGTPGADVVGLCAYNALAAATNSIGPINESNLQSSQSGTTGGNNAQNYYCNISSVTARAIRILGYVEIQQVTAGTWATGPTLVQLMGPGIRKPGDVVQQVVGTTATVGSTTSSTMVPLTNGQSLQITPTSAANIIASQVSGILRQQGVGNTANVTIQLARGSTLFGQLGFITVGTNTGSISGSGVSVNAFGFDKPNSTAVQTYNVYGEISSATLNFPQTGSTSMIILKEIMSSLPIPKNDNGTDEIRKAA